MAEGDPEDRGRHQDRNPGDHEHKPPPPRPKAQAANNHPAEPKAPATQWDVALYLVQKFPIYAVVLAFLVAAGYGASVVLGQLNEAQTELQKARDQIDDARAKADAQIADARKVADDRIAAANLREQEAAQKVATAKADALFSVQSTLLEASERVQKLAAGQITSMEQLEDIRQKTAAALSAQIAEQNAKSEEAQAALSAQIADLTAKRDELQKAIDAKQVEIGLAKIDFAIDNLERKIKQTPYAYSSEFDTLQTAFTGSDDAAIKELQQRITSADPDLKASIEFALALNTQDGKWADELAKTIDASGAQISEAWFRSVFDCCDPEPADLWSRIRPAVVRLIASPGRPALVRLAAIEPFLHQGGYPWRNALQTPEVAADDASWQAVAFLIQVIRGDFPEVDESDRGQAAVNTLATFDLSAAHVWVHWFLTSPQVSNEQKQRTQRFPEGYEESFPDIAKLLSGPPAPAVEKFWTRSNILTNHGDYSKLDLSAYSTNPPPSN